MNIVVNGSTIEFSGLLNEESSVEAIDAALKQALDHSPTRVLRLDFSKVKRANSYGILTWYNTLEALDGLFIYFNTPRWLVEQFNISNFLSDKSKVESIQAQFYCPQNDSHETMLLVLGSDLPIQNSYDNFKLNLKNKLGLELEMDFEPSEYFYFITADPEKFSIHLDFDIKDRIAA